VPGLRVFTGRVKDRPFVRLKDLPASGQTVELWWRKRRLVCVQSLCPRKTFTQEAMAVGLRASRTTVG
jgi:transposase